MVSFFVLFFFLDLVDLVDLEKGGRKGLGDVEM